MAFRCETPAVATVLQDDEGARVTRWDFKPGASTGWHTHGWPYFVVMLTDAIMRVYDGEKAFDVPRTAGETYMRPAGVEHDVMNGSGHSMAFVEIELKRPDKLFPPR
jgi:beta-alanine degradation protein BauB